VRGFHFKSIFFPRGEGRIYNFSVVVEFPWRP
jgi:hypothetical protein